MGKKRKQLSQAEVWDDSALVQSWNDALDEYKVCDNINSSCEALLTARTALSQHTRSWGTGRRCITRSRGGGRRDY